MQCITTVVEILQNKKNKYAAAGQEVIKVFEKSSSAGKSPQEIESDMLAKIHEIGPEKVSKHSREGICVFDVGLSSLQNPKEFDKSLKKRHIKYIFELNNRCYHIVLP